MAEKKNRKMLIILLLLGAGGYIYYRNKKKKEALLRSQMAVADAGMETGEETGEETAGGGGGGFGGGGFGSPDDSVGGDVISEAGDDSSVDIATGGGVTGAGSILNVNLGDTVKPKPAIQSVSDLKNPYIYGEKPMKIANPLSTGGSITKPSGGLFGGISKAIDNIGDAITGGKPAYKPNVTVKANPTIKQVPYSRPVEKKPNNVPASSGVSSVVAQAKADAIARAKAKADAMAKAKAKVNAMKGKITMKKPMKAFVDFDGDDLDFGFDD